MSIDLIRVCLQPWVDDLGANLAGAENRVFLNDLIPTSLPGGSLPPLLRPGRALPALPESNLKVKRKKKWILILKWKLIDNQV
jgi:hypothetical protein